MGQCFFNVLQIPNVPLKSPELQYIYVFETFKLLTNIKTTVEIYIHRPSFDKAVEIKIYQKPIILLLYRIT